LQLIDDKDKEESVVDERSKKSKSWCYTFLSKCLHSITSLCAVACNIKGKEILADKFHTEISDGKCTLKKCIIVVSSLFWCFI